MSLASRPVQPAFSRTGLFDQVRGRAGAALILAGFFALWIISAPGAFTIDEVVYQLMAESMAGHGRFTVSNGDDVLVSEVFGFGFMPLHAGAYTPQYPAGYALIAAPFYATFWVKGLTLLNGLSALAAVLLTHRIALRLHDDRAIAGLSAAILALATFLPNYAFAIWPHALSLAIICGAALLAVMASQAERRHRVLLASSGLLIGLAITVRADAILPAPALFIWGRFQPDWRPASAPHHGSTRPASINCRPSLTAQRAARPTPAIISASWRSSPRLRSRPSFSIRRPWSAARRR